MCVKFKTSPINLTLLQLLFIIPANCFFCLFVSFSWWLQPILKDWLLFYFSSFGQSWFSNLFYFSQQTDLNEFNCNEKTALIRQNLDLCNYIFSSVSGFTERNELLFLDITPFSDFTRAEPGLHEGDRAKIDDRRLGLDSRESSEMIDMLSSSSSGWKTLAGAWLPWKHSISTFSCNVEARYTAPGDTAGPRTRGFWISRNLCTYRLEEKDQRRDKEWTKYGKQR